MTALQIDYVSMVAPAYLLKGDRIVARRGPRRQVRPLEIRKALYAQFAELDDTPESFAGFLAAYGPVSHDGNRDGERLDVLIWMRGWMAGVVKLAVDNPGNLVLMPGWRSPESVRALARSRTGWQGFMVDKDGKKTPLRNQRGKKVTSLPPESRAALDIAAGWQTAAANLQAVVRPGAPDGRPTLCLMPDTLWDAMKLQLYQSASSGLRLKACAWCGKWFEAGATGKRAHAKFCSPRCRLHAHRQKNGG